MNTNHWVIVGTSLAVALCAVVWEWARSRETLPHVVRLSNMASSTKQADPLLTMEETIGAVFTEGQTQLYRHANPGAKDELFRLLNEEVEDMGYQVSIVEMIGYVGDASDAERLRDLLKGYRGILFESLRCHPEVAISIFKSLGVMSRRGVEGADRIIREMLAPPYWKDTFKWRPPGLSTVPLSAELESVNWAIWAYAYSEQEGLTEVRQSVLMKIEDPNVRAYMADRCDLDRLKEQVRRLREAEAKNPIESERQFLRRLYDERDSVWPRIKKLPEADAEYRRKHVLRRGPGLPPIESEQKR